MVTKIARGVKVKYSCKHGNYLSSVASTIVLTIVGHYHVIISCPALLTTHLDTSIQVESQKNAKLCPRVHLAASRQDKRSS